MDDLEISSEDFDEEQIKTKYHVTLLTRVYKIDSG